MTPGKWVAAAVVASASLIAIGYLAGSTGNQEPELKQMEETREKMLRQGAQLQAQKEVVATIDSDEEEDGFVDFTQRSSDNSISEEGRILILSSSFLYFF